ncbi:lysine biosynthesis protein LysX [Ignicoccus hospitalis]|uniref:L-2-aminoadipate N-acetyltransferase n=1 Tax=Ignicoccus hospitalis (strain KIN4/I / DSM 18386 / JCM 14125) TaxID=453591 RepID=A8A8I9_IGNH4|nr:lysine biosynthesis protein LysX [Ignicoccus hospitalis]ABU81241.1 L-2-aminoadipate N-acetyltransferase [Ignicoccus hospitalis KIN4/I]HIH90923.1 lysine biosynthesis protein LysX [Desulfurococcaceae archaeon]
MKVGIAYDHPRWEEKHIIELLRSRGHEVIEYPLRHSSFEIGVSSELPDVVVQRAVSSARAISFTAHMESMGVPVVNSLHTQLVCDNKVLTDSALNKENVPRPRTFIAYDLESALEAARELGFPLVVKPLQGSWGRLQALVKDEDALKAIIEHREAMPSPQFKVHYLQEYINKPNRDIRVFVVGDSVPVAIYRISEREWRTNTALGGRAEKAEVDEELEELAIKAARAVGGGVLGVDVVEDPERGYLVIEVNSNVDFKNTYKVTGFDMGEAIIDYALSLVKR